MAVVSANHDKESFLDEYTPLCEEKKKSKMEQIRLRCFSELTNNPVSKFRRRNHAGTKKEKRKSMLHEAKNVSDSSLEYDNHTERRDSGYFSIEPEGEKIFFISEDGNCISTSTTDMEPIIADEKDSLNQTPNKKASSFVKQRTKFLLYKHNMKFTVPKSKESKKTPQKEKEKCPENEDMKTRSKKLSWKKAKKQATNIVRFIRRDGKKDDEVSLINSEENNNSKSSLITSTIRDQSSIKNRKNLNDSTIENNLEDTEDDDDYIIPIRRQEFKRSRPVSRRRPRSLFSHSYLPKMTAETSLEDGNVDFVEKYLNRSKSLDDILDSNHLHNTENQSIFYDLDHSTSMYDITDDLFEQSSKERVIEEENEEFTGKRLERIIEEEVDNYILTGQSSKNETNSLANIRRSGTLSYSVNNLYDLINSESLFSVDSTYDTLVV
ncbi:uncharacterized protein LOC130645726 [Hydractinia symbiolongicarpus]|uniref:uncharacterized protein LOC130645726 n=1 Tax=Hydractinia symbiolongicarpus TaxID=13093 RepID=UPI00254F3BB7|nr:uncharacterized protein LOC130645726 [Hydractinia symbiolongicarpus]